MFAFTEITAVQNLPLFVSSQITPVKRLVFFPIGIWLRVFRPLVQKNMTLVKDLTYIGLCV